MSSSQSQNHCSISLTDRAANKIKELQQKEGKQNWGLRFADKQGFCGKGYEYIIDLTSTPQPQDEIFYSHEVAIYTPKESMKRLQGSIIECNEIPSEDERLSILEKLGFTVSNPNIKGPCPCTCNRGFDA